MDVSLSAKPQTLTLISCLSPSSSTTSSPSSTTTSSPSSSRRFCSLQKEFLGCGHRLRPPGLRSNKKCKQAGFQIRSPRFIFKASLFSQPVVVIVAVATVSAITVVYLNYTRRNKDVKKHTGPDAENVKSIAVSVEEKDLLQKRIENRNLDRGDISVDSLMVERNFRTENHSESVHTADKRGILQKRTSSLHEVSVTTEASHSSGSDVLKGSVLTKTVEGIPEISTEGPSGADFGLKSLGLVVQPVPDGTVIPVHIENEETKEDHKLNHAVSEETKKPIPGYSGLFKQSSREELYTFYEENQVRQRPVSNFRDLDSQSTYPAPHNKSLSSLLRTTTLCGSKVSTQSFQDSSVPLEEQMPLAHYSNGSSSKRKDYQRVGEFPRNIVNGYAPHNSETSWPNSHQSNGRHAICTDSPAKYLSTYNTLLRNGRLAECIELLESMEQKGLLDMDKIYHARFFNICKSQKAVKEGFRFAKFITNPTLSTFNMLLSVCASSQNSEGAFQVLDLVKEAGLRVDCKLYTTLISTCAKSGKVDTMFKVFHEMVSAGVEPNLHTYGALIDGCARAGQVAKAFGAYGILRFKNVKPDRVVFNALITACGQSGAVDRAFDVLAEMRAEPTPVDPDHVTIGALIKTCAQAGQFDRVREVYKMIRKYKIKGTPEVYTIAVGSCSQTGDLEFALIVYKDMTRNGVTPDEMFLSSLIDVAGHAGEIDVAFEVLQEARSGGIELGNITYGSLMGACCNSKNWQKALEVYEDIKSMKLNPTVSTMNALVTALCDGDQLQKAVEVLGEMKKAGVYPNIITYSILLVGSEKKDDLEVGHMLYSQARKEGITSNLVICKCLIGMCLRRFEKAYSLGEDILSFKSGKPQIDNKWTSMALKTYRETIGCGVLPTMEVFSLVLGCLKFPHDTSSKVRLQENLGVSLDPSKSSNLNSLIDGFGEYDPRSFSLLEEATSHEIVQSVSFKRSPIVVDVRKMKIPVAEVYVLTVLKGLKHRFHAGARLPNINIILPVEMAQVLTGKEEKTIKLAGRVGQAIGALLRRLGLRYQGNESFGKIRINGISIKRWFQPKLALPFSGKPPGLNPTLGNRIANQQRDIRMSNLSLAHDANGGEN